MFNFNNYVIKSCLKGKCNITLFETAFTHIIITKCSTILAPKLNNKAKLLVF